MFTAKSNLGVPGGYPAAVGERNFWIRSKRPAKNRLDPLRPYAFLWEEELGPDGDIWPTACVFLTNKECPFSCLMCDLWKNTLDWESPAGAISTQIEYAVARLPASRQIKLYNAGSFFDPSAIAPADYPSIARAVSVFDHVVVECHPAFVGEGIGDFEALLGKKCEVAIGLETSHEPTLRLLNKQMTLSNFRTAAEYLKQRGNQLRVFVLLNPPFMDKTLCTKWAKHSLETAFDAGADVCCVIPTRSGNGALDQLAGHGDYTAPGLRSLEDVMEYGIGLKQGRVFVDLWDIDRFFSCTCSAQRRDRLARMNQSQHILESISCECSETPA